MSDELNDGDGRALLFIDILGTKAVWTEEGCDGARELFNKFARLIKAELKEDPTFVVSGAVESDCVALICRDPSAAVQLGVAIYQRAFFRAKNVKNERMWLRGVIVPVRGPADVRWLRESRPLSDDLPQVSFETYSADLLDAISMEKAGFRGMRLLLDPALDSAALRRGHRIEMPDGYKPLHPFRHLEHSGYGKRLEGHLDILWMVDADPEEWRMRRMRMSTRMRHSARNPDEVLQAAATQVVFDECDAIIDSLDTTVHRVVRRKSIASK